MKDYCYELCVVFSPMIEEQKDYHYNTVRDLLEEHNCQILGEDDWGRKEFAYPMKKYTSGYYLYIVFKSDSNVPRVISDTLHLNELILREMIIKRVIGKDIILRDDNTVDTMRSYVSAEAAPEKAEVAAVDVAAEVPAEVPAETAVAEETEDSAE